MDTPALSGRLPVLLHAVLQCRGVRQSQHQPVQHRKERAVRGRGRPADERGERVQQQPGQGRHHVLEPRHREDQLGSRRSSRAATRTAAPCPRGS